MDIDPALTLSVTGAKCWRAGTNLRLQEGVVTFSFGWGAGVGGGEVGWN